MWTLHRKDARYRILQSAVTMLVLFFVASVACAQTSLAVYPFSSQEPVLGVAVADILAATLDDAVDAAPDDALTVYGPAVTPAFVAPFVVEDGFLSPLLLLNASGADLADANGAALLREALGVDVAVTGRVRFASMGLELELFIATGGDGGGVQRYTLNAPEGEPGRLVGGALTLVSSASNVARPLENTSFDLSNAYGDFAEGLTLLSAGFVNEARASLERAVDAGGDETGRWQAVLDDVIAAQEGRAGADPILDAALALNLEPFDALRAQEAFARLAEATALPAADLWQATLSVSEGDDAGAAFDAAATYPYGLAARALYQAVREEGAQEDVQADISQVLQTDARGALLGAALAAQGLQDLALEKAVLTRLTRVAPALAYPFEQLSFIAFDEENPLAAAEALVVATELEPQSNLYWTNLGWAYYLLGLLEESERASVRATGLITEDTLQPWISFYNLGLARVVTGRLGEAMSAYDEALFLDPEVDDEALADLENALTIYPDAPGVSFALATLYEAKGRTDEAARQYERFIRRSEAEDEGDFVEEAQTRLSVLRAPPAALELPSGGTLSLGLGGGEAAPYRPGDRLYPVFELSTPGAELPSEVVVELTLQDANGAPVDDLTLSQQLSLPRDAVAVQIDDVGLDLPTTLAPGAYTLEVAVTAEGDRRATLSLPFDLTGEPSFLRGLLSRDITLRNLENLPLYARRDLSAPDADAELVSALITALRDNADAAEEVLPTPTAGRFEGVSGGEIFNMSTETDVQDFLSYLLASTTGSADLTFVDAYAQWALENAE